jgi:hypothetical protein
VRAAPPAGPEEAARSVAASAMPCLTMEEDDDAAALPPAPVTWHRYTLAVAYHDAYAVPWLLLRAVQPGGQPLTWHEVLADLAPRMGAAAALPPPDAPPLAGALGALTPCEHPLTGEVRPACANACALRVRRAATATSRATMRRSRGLGCTRAPLLTSWRSLWLRTTPMRCRSAMEATTTLQPRRARPIQATPPMPRAWDATCAPGGAWRAGQWALRSMPPPTRRQMPRSRRQRCRRSRRRCNGRHLPPRAPVRDNGTSRNLGQSTSLPRPCRCGGRIRLDLTPAAPCRASRCLRALCWPRPAVRRCDVAPVSNRAGRAARRLPRACSGRAAGRTQPPVRAPARATCRAEPQS